MTLNDRNNEKPRVLLVDDDIEFRKTVEIVLRKNNYDVYPAGGLSVAYELLATQNIDIIITDLKLGDGSGMDLIAKAKGHHRELAVIILTAFGSIRNAVEAMRRGAYDYIAKPFRNDELLILVEKALENKEIREELSVLREEIAWKYSFDSLVGISEPIEQLKSLAKRVADSDIVILLTGESGTGKELMAKAIHYHSARRKQKFVPIECTSIPENLMESEFFGHVKGSFTSAHVNRKGLFEEADRGTVFLDEVGDMPLTLQSKLLRVLQESEIRVVGSSETKKVDLRIIAATNRNLGDAVKEGQFREDLFYRLNVLPINIPPLRERADDIPVLIEHFLRKENKSNHSSKISISSGALERLLTHNWPGNVRELENTIKRAIALSPSDRINADDIVFINSGRKMIQPSGQKMVLKRDEFSGGTLEDSLKYRIETMLYANNWNLTKTATKLGIGRTTLWRKIKKYKIRKNEEVTEDI